MMNLQKKGFFKEASQQTALPVLRSYLKLYSVVSMEKLATLLGKSDKEALRYAPQ